MTIAALRALIDEEMPGIPRHPAPRLNRRPTTREEKPVDTTTAVAVSMYKDSEKLAAITEATGLTNDQIAAAVAAAGIVFVAERETPTAPKAVQLVPEQPQPTTAETLIAWGMQHPAARMQRLADQARTALAGLQQSQRREAVVSAAEEQVQKLTQQLADAQQALKAAKTGAVAAAPAAKPAPAVRPSRDELAAIRTWARANGRLVADRGMPSRQVIDAYRAAHPTQLATTS